MRMSDWSSDVCSSDLFAGRGLYQRRAGEEDRALVADDDAFVGHGGHIRAAGGAASHHARDLRNAERAHVGLVEEDAAEMVTIGEDLGLMRQVGTARIDEVDARQPVDRSEEHTSELQSLMRNSYAVFCLKKKKN